MAKRGLRKAEPRRCGEGGSRVLTNMVTDAGCPLCSPAGREAGSMEGAGKVILYTNKGPGACHPTQCWPCKTQ